MKLISPVAVLCSLLALLPSAYSQPGFRGLSFGFRRRPGIFGRRTFGGFRRRGFPLYLPGARPFGGRFRYVPFGRMTMGFPRPAFPTMPMFAGIPPLGIPRAGLRPFSGRVPFSPASTMFRMASIPQPTTIPLSAVSADRFRFDSRARTIPPARTFFAGDTAPLRSVSSSSPARRTLSLDSGTRTFLPTVSSGFGGNARILPPASSLTALSSASTLTPTVGGFGFDNSLDNSQITRTTSIGGIPADNTFNVRGNPTFTSSRVSPTSRTPAGSGRARGGSPRLGGSVLPRIRFRNGRPVFGRTDDGLPGLEVGMGGHGDFPIMGGVGAGETFNDGGLSLGLANGIEGNEQIEAALRPTMAAEIARGPPTEDDIRAHRELVRRLNAGTRQRGGGMQGTGGGFGLSNTFGTRAMTQGDRFRQQFR